MSTRIVIGSLVSTVILTIALVLMWLQTWRLQDEVTVLRAQMASHADMVQVSQSYAAVNHRLDNVEFNMGGLNGAVDLLKQRKDEITTDDMQHFSANLDAILNDIDQRLTPLEADLTKRHLHY
jgi:hypothetical protein